MGYWKFDECEGVVAHDSAATSDVAGNNGSINIGASGTQTTAGTCSVGTGTTAAWGNGSVGKYNSSLNFDGTDDYVRIPNSTSYLPTSAISYSIWAKHSGSWAGWDALFGRYNCPRVQFSGSSTLYIDDFPSANKPTPANMVSNTVFSNDIWYHIAYVYNGSSLKLYVNGKLDKESSEWNGLLSWVSGKDYTVGTPAHEPYGFVNFFPGQIDDVKIFNYALTATQIKNEYNQGSAIRFGPVTGSP